ncbi:MAG: hypothetical protein Q9O62_01490 [Ardenticatenia bacterium]|nr:hypothetical protein [Ardenticatenia bacterium]
MSYLNVEEYRVRVHRDDGEVDGAVWVREGQEWELEAANLHLVADASAVPETRPDVFFARLKETLEADGVRLLTCGTCAFFRRSDAPDDDGWKGYCTWSSDELPISPPEHVTLLAPNCHRFAYRQGPPEPVDSTWLAQARSAEEDQEETAVLPQLDKPRGLIGIVRRLLGRTPATRPAVPTAIIERPGGQPCPCCGTRMTNRASISNVDETGSERIFSVWRCPHCLGNFLDDWLEAFVGSRARDAERIYVVPPAEANMGVKMVARCPRPDEKGCTCVANRHFDTWGDFLYQHGRRMKHRESVVSL